MLGCQSGWQLERPYSHSSTTEQRAVAASTHTHTNADTAHIAMRVRKILKTEVVMHGLEPLNADEYLFFFGNTGTVFVYDCLKDSIVASDAREGIISTSPSLYGDVLCLPSFRPASTIEGLEINSGEVLWRKNIGIVQSVISAGDTLFAVTSTGGLYCFVGRDSSERWKHEIGTNVFSPLAIHGDGVYVSSDTGFLTALNRHTGRVNWRQSVGSIILASFISSGAAIIVLTSDGDIISMQLPEGKQLWRTRVSSAVRVTPVADKAAIYVSSSDGTVNALRKDVGDLRWAFNTSALLRVAPVLYGNYLFLASDDRTVRLLRCEDGTEMWRMSVEPYDISTLFRYNDTIFAVCETGEILLFVKQGMD
jgi:outer membrane protein assembly factor BamB